MVACIDPQPGETIIDPACGTGGFLLSADRWLTRDPNLTREQLEQIGNRAATWSEATPEGRWRAYAYDELVARDKCSLDLTWLRDDSLLDADNLPEPDALVAEIADDLRAALAELEGILADLDGAGGA